jgi:tRNA G18 (ribose-2'-O)-methylase SpoU
MNSPLRTARVRCPAPRCGRVIELLPEWLGRNMYCPACGERMTAKPLSVEAGLREKERKVTGGSGAPIERLPLVALVDNVRSLWNVGSIFRTADACGFREVVLAGISGCPPRAEISKTALGADEAVPWRYHADVTEALHHLRDAGYATVAVETSERAIPLQRFDWPSRVCLVVGNEVAGVSAAAQEGCDHHVRIPMYGVKSSLNVAVAFGVAAYSASTALRKGALESSDGDPG